MMDPPPIQHLSDTLNQLNIGALALDRFGRVTQCNANADRLFSDEFRVVGEQLTITDPHSAAAYAKFIRDLRGIEDADLTRYEPIIVRRRDRAPLLLKIVPVAGADWTRFDQPKVLVVLQPVEPIRNVPTERIRMAFGLTASEARVATGLVGGATIREVAEDLGISVNTARVHLQIIFQKTGTGRQSELVALMASLA